MSTIITFNQITPFNDPTDRDEIRTFFSEQGYTVCSFTRDSNQEVFKSVELIETLDESQKTSVQNQVTSGVQNQVTSGTPKITSL